MTRDEKIAEIVRWWPDFVLRVDDAPSTTGERCKRVVAAMTVKGVPFEVPTVVLAANVDTAKDVLVDTCHRIAMGRTDARP